MSNELNLDQVISLQQELAVAAERRAARANSIVSKWRHIADIGNPIMHLLATPLVALRILPFPEAARREELQSGLEANFRQNLAEMLADKDAQAIRVIKDHNQTTIS